jgi:hypothetical protein
VTAASLIEGVGTSHALRRRCEEEESALRSEIDGLGLDLYPLVVAAPNVGDGMATLVQAWGVGPIRSNTVLLNGLETESSEPGTSAELWYARTLAGAVRLGQHVIVLETVESRWEELSKIPPGDRRIDVWWFDDESSRLMLLLAHLMTRTEDWDEAVLRVLVRAPADAAERVQRDLARRLDEFRIQATVEAIVEPALAGVLEASRGSAFVFVPLRIEGMRLSDPFGFGINALLEGLPTAALVAAAQDVHLSEEAPVEVVEAETETPPRGEPEAQQERGEPEQKATKIPG